MKKWLFIAGGILLIAVGFSLLGDESIGAGLFSIVIGIVLVAYGVIKVRKKVDAIKAKAADTANNELRKQGIYPQFKNANYDLNNIVVIDTETTGVDAKKDEMLQLSIISGNGDVLFNHLLKPVHRRKWDEASSVNGIIPEMVKNEKHIDYYADEVAQLLDGKTIVGYNVDFDTEFLKKAELVSEDASGIDIMKPFAWINGEYDSRHDDYKWKKLNTCARYYGYAWEGKQHDSLADCKATLYCFKRMCGM